MKDWVDWALRTLLLGACALLINQIQNHAEKLNALNLSLETMRYDLKSIVEKAAETRDQLRSLNADVMNLQKGYRK